MGREENVLVFEDTERLCRQDERLKASIAGSLSGQRLIPEGEALPKPDLKKYPQGAGVLVSPKRSFEAAYLYRDQKTCVLNFASWTNPGGGVVKGSTAQEECLCRCSTLYFCLNTKPMWDGFYGPHRQAQDPLHNGDCIYTPNVTVFKSDTEKPELLPEKERFTVNVITCAAPNLRPKPENRMNAGDGDRPVKVSPKQLKEIHISRLSRVLDIAASEGNEAVILGAFGCGAFLNDPRVVAAAAKEVLPAYLHAFRVIEFAVYCSPRDDSNYRIFRSALTGM